MKNSRQLAIGMVSAALGLIFYCGSFYVKSYHENKQAGQAYDNLREACLTGEESKGRNGKFAEPVEVLADSKGAEKDKNLENGEQKTTGMQTQESEKTIQESFGIRWSELKKVNAETVAWITVPGAGISYPVVQGEDDEYYLHHSIRGEEDAFGTIFLGSGNKKDFQDSHSFLYGHNMEGNMMFANLNRYEEKEFLEECPEFYIITPAAMFRYKIFSVEQAGELSPGFQYGYALGSRPYEVQMKLLAENSMYDIPVSVDFDEPMVTLLTCNSRLDEQVRMAVHGIRQDVWKYGEDEEFPVILE